jgi:hypothetical protein
VQTRLARRAAARIAEEHLFQRISFSPGSLMDDVKPPSVVAGPKPADAGADTPAAAAPDPK